MTTLASDHSTTELSLAPYAGSAEPDRQDTFEELPGRPLRQKLRPFSLVLCACLVAGGFFYAGVRVEKGNVGSSSGITSAASSNAAIRSGTAGTGATTATSGASRAGSTSGASATAPGGVSSAVTTGTIKLVAGSFVYVSETDGTIVKVAVNARTMISVTSSATPAELHPGDTVIVSGPTGPGGTINATAVSDHGASAIPGGSTGSGSSGVAATGAAPS
jgi:hypothetical protein